MGERSTIDGWSFRAISRRARQRRWTCPARSAAERWPSTTRWKGFRCSRRRPGPVSRFNDRSLERLRALLATRPAITIDAPEHRRAAVLVPLIRHDDGWSILFSRRAANLAAHSGQIAFPGGAAENGEAPAEAAVREAGEEVGIDRASVGLI